MIHSFHTPTDGIALPKAFTFPFHYTPHPLTRLAADEVRQYLLTRDDWREALLQGKMFGVLVLKDAEGKPGYCLLMRLMEFYATWPLYRATWLEATSTRFSFLRCMTSCNPTDFSALRKRRFPASTTGLPPWKLTKHTARHGRNGRRRKKWMRITDAMRATVQ